MAGALWEDQLPGKLTRNPAPRINLPVYQSTRSPLYSAIAFSRANASLILAVSVPRLMRM